MPSLRSLIGRCLASWVSLLLVGTVSHAAWIWVEGEKPSQTTMHRHPFWYDQVIRNQLSGGDFISNWNEKPGEATYNFVAPAAGPYDFWVRANPVQTKLSYQLNGGAWTLIDLESGQQETTNVAVDGKIDLRFLAWSPVGKVGLVKGQNRIRFQMASANNNHGSLDSFVFSNEPFRPKGILKPDAVSTPSKAEKGWFAFEPKTDPFHPASGISLRLLNEKNAGDGGFIAAKGSSFIHSKTGLPLRFWAVNGPSSRERDALAIEAKTLAKRGVNMVRVHHAYFDKNGDVDPKEINHAFDVVETMKAEGIYSHFSIYFPLWLTPKPETTWLPGYDGKKNPFAALYFNKDFQKQYQVWWKALLLTPHPKTGARLIDDPAVAGLEIINEDSYFFWTFTPDNIPDPELRILESQFGTWAKAKYGSVEQTLKSWNGLADKRDNLQEGRLGFRPLYSIANDRTARDKDTARFLLESQRRFYTETIAFLRELGFKGVITTSNWATANPQVLGPIEKYSYTVGDFIDRHGYFGCKNQGASSEWSIRDGHSYVDRSALKFDPEEPGKPKIFTHPMMDISYDNKPSMISETTWNRPNRYRSEAPLYFAAYGALQDSDAIVHFALDGANWSVKPGYFMQPWTLMSPAMMGQFPAAAMVYRKGLIAPGDLLVNLTLGVNDILDLQGTPLPQDAAFDELRLKDVPKGTTIQPGQVIDPLVHFAGRTNVNFAPKSAPAQLKDLSRLIDRKNQKVTSSTGELQLDYQRGTLTINAPSAQGASGTLRDLKLVRLRDISISSSLDLGHIIAISLDGKPLASSQKILLQVMSEEKASGFKSEPDSTGVSRITSIGQDPWLVRNLDGIVKFHRPDAAKLKVTALDPNGDPLHDLGNASEITLEPTTLYYLIHP